MLLLTIGGDMRYAYLTAQAAAQSMDIAAIGLENSRIALPYASLDNIQDAEAILLPNPWRAGLQLPLSKQAFTLDEVIARASPDACFLLSDTVGMPTPAPLRSFIDLSENEEYLMENARITAEAALFRAYQNAGVSFYGAKCMIIGFGRIGKQLSAMLLSLGADVAVAVRSEPAKHAVRALGAAVFSMEEMRLLLSRSDYIFSTPPAAVLDEALLRFISSEAVLLDLASPPFGFDLKLACRLGVRAFRENGLPGRCCPKSAAAVLLKAVKDALSTDRKECFHEPDSL